MIWLQFAAAALVIVLAGARLARYGDVLGEKTGLGRSWIGVVLLATTTSLPELFTGFGATALAPLPNIALGDVLGSCMFNLLILSLMDAVHPEPISARAHQSHALAIGFGLLLIGVAGTGLVAGNRLPTIAWIGLYSPVLIAIYFVAMRVIFAHEQQRRARETHEVAEELHYGAITFRSARGYCSRSMPPHSLAAAVMTALRTSASRTRRRPGYYAERAEPLVRVAIIVALYGDPRFRRWAIGLNTSALTAPIITRTRKPAKRR